MLIFYGDNFWLKTILLVTYIQVKLHEAERLAKDIYTFQEFATMLYYIRSFVHFTFH